MPTVFFTEDDMCTTLKLEMKKIQDFFIANDWEVVKDPEHADIILCNTCSGWEKLEQKSLNMLGQLNKLGRKVISVGCVNDNNPDAVSKIHSGPIISTRKLSDIELLIPDPKVKLADIPYASTFRSKNDYRLYDLTKRFVNIAGGCSFSCSYCPHKVGLGPLKSRPIESILEQINNIVIESTVRIVVLTGMETAYYGKDIGTSYPELLRKIFEIDANFEIHIAQFNPIGITNYYDELYEIFSNERITDIQIPIQTTSNRLLKLMHRHQVIQEAGKFLREIKKKNKKVVLRTDIMVGFPTETMEELQNTLEFVTDIFDEIAVYAVEIRKGLPIEKLSNDAFSHEEQKGRVKYAEDYIEIHGKMAHGGQQSDVSLIEIEERKKLIREKKQGCC